MRRFRRNLLAAVAMCAAALILSPAAVFAQGNVSFEIQRAETLIAQGDYVEALATVRSAISSAPSDYRVRYYSGMALLGLQRFDEARTEAELALSLAPEADKAGVQRLLDTIALQSVSLTAEADAEAALAAGLTVRAARLFAQAFEADSTKTEAGFRAAALYASSLNQPVEAVRVLRAIEAGSPDGTARVRAIAELKVLAPKVKPAVENLIAQAQGSLQASDATGATELLDEAEGLDPTRADIAIERVRVAALGDDGRALEAALLGLAQRGVEIDDVIYRLPRSDVWANEAWLLQLLEDYRGGEYSRKVRANVLAMMLFPLGKAFRDQFTTGSGEGPEMVVLSPGSFIMGSPGAEAGRESDESPQLKVEIGYLFAIGKYEVTWSQYSACVSARSCPKVPNDGFGQGSRPVTNVSWNDAQSYITWLNQKTGLTGRSDRYRLPTEAEWEYAARAGSQARWSFGDDESRLGNFAWFSGNSGSRTQPVGGKTANGFGLHDMHGNVWEWVEDCYESDYSVQPSDGSAFMKSSCSSRVFRGGSWYGIPQFLRSALRSWDSPGNRSYLLGFRLARTLP